MTAAPAGVHAAAAFTRSGSCRENVESADRASVNIFMSAPLADGLGATTGDESEAGGLDNPSAHARGRPATDRTVRLWKRPSALAVE